MLTPSIRNFTLPLKVRMLSAACKRLQTASSENPVTGLNIFLLMLAWGNVGYAAGHSYLKHVACRSLVSKGPILECGSGASTILIGALTKKRNVPVLVLENSEEWHQFMSKVLKSLKFTHVQVIHAPLKDYNNYSWYGLPEGSRSELFDLVVCDGPPGSTPGGRYGLLPVMSRYLALNCTVLLDDTHRKAERDIIDAWRTLRPLEANSMGMLGGHSELTLR